MRQKPAPTHNPHFTGAYAAYHRRIRRILARITRVVRILNQGDIKFEVTTTHTVKNVLAATRIDNLIGEVRN